ncbi:MAG: MOSC domain-containing protein [Actinomycetota bacterium]
MPLATVVRFNVTPVKSTALHHPDAVDLQREGAVGDRRFLFARPAGTRLRGISKAPLMPIVSTWSMTDERLTMRFPDGSSVEGSALPVGERLDIKLFDRTVPARAIDPVFTEAVRRVVVDETLSVFRVDEPEFAGGVHRASIISLASVVDVGSRGGDARLDPRRFRMLVELDGVEAFAEDGWLGRRLHVGDAVVHLRQRIHRCMMTNLAPDTGENDFDTMKVLAQHRKVGTELLVGVYGDVEQPGRIEIGDTAGFFD